MKSLWPFLILCLIAAQGCGDQPDNVAHTLHYPANEGSTHTNPNIIEGGRTTQKVVAKPDSTPSVVTYPDWEEMANPDHEMSYSVANDPKRENAPALLVSQTAEFSQVGADLSALALVSGYLRIGHREPDGSLTLPAGRLPAVDHFRDLRVTRLRWWTDGERLTGPTHINETLRVYDTQRPAHPFPTMRDTVQVHPDFYKEARR